MKRSRRGLPASDSRVETLSCQPISTGGREADCGRSSSHISGKFIYLIGIYILGVQVNMEAAQLETMLKTFSSSITSAFLVILFQYGKVAFLQAITSPFEYISIQMTSTSDSCLIASGS